jgi:hypothetical protein
MKIGFLELNLQQEEQVRKPALPLDVLLKDALFSFL